MFAEIKENYEEQEKRIAEIRTNVRKSKRRRKEVDDD
jgi:hypothetical protein